MRGKFFKTLIHGIVTLGLVSHALAADRHVYLDTDGDGQLNDCPNPSHNAKGTSNTDELSYCSGGSQAGKLIGAVSGTTTSGNCTGGGGNVTSVTNGVSADVDGDGTNERIYGHPQACTWNAALSDSCEVHAGTYVAAGARCQKDCGDTSTLGGSATACDRGDCWFASVVMSGHGPNFNNNAYGTQSSPFYLRGAQSRGSIDTWDSDGDKIPDSEGGEPTSYPAILSGDRDNDGVFDQTTQPGSTLTGDTYAAIWLGCGDGSFGRGICGGNTFAPEEHGPQIDTDANGTFDQELTRSGPYNDIKETKWVTIKDLEFKRYNGGNDQSSLAGSRQTMEGRFTLIGDGGTPGIVVDHIYLHDSDSNYSGALTDQTSRKAQWSEFGDQLNGACTNGIPNNRTEVKQSFVQVNQSRLYINDGDELSQTGCPIRFHDNRILLYMNNNRTRIIQNGGNPGYRLFYLKAIDATGSNTPATPKVHRIYNNEFIIRDLGASTNNRMFDVQAFGNSQSLGLGEIWFYGNLIREHSSVVRDFDKFYGAGCRGDDASASASFRWVSFNNTYDATGALDNVCGEDGSQTAGPGEILVDRNNAYFGPTEVCVDNQGTEFELRRRSNNCFSAQQSPSCAPGNSCDSTTKSNWFAGNSSNAGYYNGLTVYAPKSAGDLVSIGSCDPDGDGTAGVDYDGDGLNDTSWRDLANNLVNCSSSSSPMAIGAIQLAAGGQGNPGPAPPPVENLRRSDRHGS